MFSHQGAMELEGSFSRISSLVVNKDDHFCVEPLEEASLAHLQSRLILR